MRKILKLTKINSTVVISSDESDLVIMYSHGQGGGGPLLIAINEIDGGQEVLHNSEFVAHEALELKLLRAMAMWVHPVVGNPMMAEYMQTRPGTADELLAYDDALAAVYKHFHVERSIA
jgi:hypothetical protein